MVFQGILAKYFNKYKIILIDFHHQLCRSTHISINYPIQHVIGEEIDTIN